MRENGLSVGKLLEKTYGELTKRHGYQEITLPQKAVAEIADDTDWHRSRTGYMGYDKVHLIKPYEKNWVIGRGEKCGQYPAEPYDSDIIAFEASTEGKKLEQIQKELMDKIGSGWYFLNSLVYGMADGSLCVRGDNKFGKRMSELLKPKISQFISQRAEYNTSLILASTLQHPTTKEVLYKPKFVDFLADSIETALKECENKKEVG